MQSKAKKQAFTLLELVVVMAIVAALGILGFNAIAGFRRSTELSEAAGEVVAAIKETQNMAKNNTLPKELNTVDAGNYLYYQLMEFKPTTNIFTRTQLCRIKEPSLAASSVCPVTGGAIEKTTLQSLTFANVTFDNTGLDTCNFLLFQNLTGDISWSANVGATPNFPAFNNNSTCYIRLKHKELTTRLVIIVDTVNNNFKYENE